jgi:nucleotide-binding universal stress UspA family protein
MFSTLVVASDGSDASDRIVDCLGHLRRVGAERVVLIHVFDVRHVGGLYESLRPAMEARLATQRQVLEREGYEVQIETPLGMPFHEINAAGQRHDASALVVGSLGQSLLADITLGSTAHEVLHHATRPILLLVSRRHRTTRRSAVASSVVTSSVIRSTRRISRIPPSGPFFISSMSFARHADA